MVRQWGVQRVVMADWHLLGWKGYTTNLVGQPADFVIGAYHQLWRIEEAFRMSRHDLQLARSTTALATRSRRT